MPLNQTIRPVATVEVATEPKIYNVSVPLANTEVSQALTANTKLFTIQVRGGLGKLKLAFVSGESGTKFITIERGSAFDQMGIKFTGTLYFQSSVAGVTVEIVEWV